MSPRWWRGWRAARGAGALLLAVWALSVLALSTRRATGPSAPAPHAPATTRSAPASHNAPHAADDDRLREDAQRRLPSLPLDYWHRHKDRKDMRRGKDCAPLPSLYDLEFHNVYWQSLRTANGTFHLYGAYLDARNASLIGPAVRLLAVHDRIKPTLVTHCQLWFDGRNEPTVVRVLEYKYVWNSKWGNHRDGVLQPYLLACVLPADVRTLVPAAVSLVERACDRAPNLLAVRHERPPERKEFAVCVKGLDFPREDLSLRLVEWLELVLLLGADKVYLYELAAHPNVRRVLRHYEARGLADVTPLTLPGAQPNLPELRHMYLKKKTTHKRQMELVPYNDCLYRNLYRYRWLALLDIDEVIVPVLDADWSSLMARTLPASAPAKGRPARSSYHAANLYFLDSLRHEHEWPAAAPRYMHMMQHVWRTSNFTKPGQYVKAFHETSRVLALHNHFPLACLGGACSSYALPTETARLQHYRADCVSALSKTCGELRASPRRDTALWRWREPLVARVTAAVRALGLVPDVPDAPDVPDPPDNSV